MSPDARYNYLFNSYYNAIGDPWSRTNRGLLSRPSVDEVYDFRKFADGQPLRNEVDKVNWF